LIVLEPKKRFNAKEALDHPFFKEKPYPKICAKILNDINESHEVDARRLKHENKEK